MQQDPFGDSAFIGENCLEIHACNGRDLEGINLSAPRLLHPVRGEFAVQAATAPASAEKPAIGGLLIWKDPQNYLRLERGTGGPRDICFQGCLENQERILGRGRLPAEVVFLRLERRQGRVRALCSADGRSWFAVGEVSFPVDDPRPPAASTQVGLHAIGSIDRLVYPGAYPEGTAIRFDAFDLRQ